MKRRIGALLMALCMVGMLAACGGDGEPAKTREPLPVTGDLTVAVLRVGKADAIVITTATKTMVIDTGEIDDGGKVLNYLNECGRSTVDHLLITHYDRDHVGGAERVLDFVAVQQVIRPDYVGVREEYTAFLDAIAAHEVTDTVLSGGSDNLVFMMDDVEVTVNAPAKTDYTDANGALSDNDYSLVVTLRHGSRVLLFAADCEDLRLAELITDGRDLSADFLKVPYHGNFTQLTASFLSKVKPTYAVVCDSEKNPAADETMTALQQVGAQVYETKDGSVLCHSDGEVLTLTQRND